MTSVLVVDDSRLARRVAVGILERLRPGWGLIEAPSADAAIAAFQDHAIDIALVDINMPGMDGLSLVQHFRSVHPDVAVAVVSANIQDETVARARAMDATFLAKPLTVEALAPFLDGAALRLKRSAARAEGAGPHG
jgi:CheY-like chemotaxis protein